ncbi:patatin-like phospholipase family protein [Pedobacter sp. SD-b]|uniref:Patatin-like phospholipase family protein n=1 Tax=Pedobacter segetis TaxID=2793069 RepID=A0ABS1BJ06_9SPHI|nr:patatin-like phospholipase family protein [Pedobacter segetis]MBK0382731.1 patatin-like phospholipase family protein [Pedobacter segetis]
MKIGIVLSGGGIRGIAHLGVLKAVKDKKIPISMITGTSAGAIAGALFANDIDPYQALQIFQETKLLRFLRPAFRSPALLSLESTIPLFKKYLPHDSFENLKIPLIITATNFNKGKLVYFKDGDLIRKVLASSCIPGVFNPIMIEGEYYVDGGVLNNFPIEPLLKNCDFVIGSSCNHLPELDKFRNIKHVFERAAVLSINSDMEEKLKGVDFLIEPNALGETSLFDTKRAEEIFWLAHEETLKRIDELKNQIEIKEKGVIPN